MQIGVRLSHSVGGSKCDLPAQLYCAKRQQQRCRFLILFRSIDTWKTTAMAVLKMQCFVEKRLEKQIILFISQPDEFKQRVDRLIVRMVRIHLYVINKRQLGCLWERVTERITAGEKFNPDDRFSNEWLRFVDLQSHRKESNLRCKKKWKLTNITCTRGSQRKKRRSTTSSITRCSEVAASLKHDTRWISAIDDYA